ncbi:MAG: hypothetical protein EXR93_03700 [Gemmatimonadetes bacterium]|nr:hypothetical protein [Gemmatimonadota bacterium]
MLSAFLTWLAVGFSLAESGTLIVANMRDNTASIIDIATRTIRGYMSVGQAPDGIGYSQVVTGR